MASLNTHGALGKVTLVTKSSRQLSEINDVVYCPSVGSILAFGSSLTYVLDTSSALNVKEILPVGDVDHASFIVSKSCVVLQGPATLSSRRDYHGVYFLRTALHARPPDAIDSERIIHIEFIESEAKRIVIYCEAQADVFLAHSDLIESLRAQVQNTPTYESDSKHSLAIEISTGAKGKWRTVVVSGTVSALSSFAKDLFASAMKSVSTVLGSASDVPHSTGTLLPVAAALLERVSVASTAQPYRKIIEDGVANLAQSSNSDRGPLLDLEKCAMASELARRVSFSRWPHMHYKWALPDSMAEAGFYHQPNTAGDDRAMCFTCSICLVCWEPADEPWSEHERHSPKCPYVCGKYTQNVPIGVTYASWPALALDTEEPTRMLSTNSNSDYVATSTTHGEVIMWSVSRQLARCAKLMLEPSEPYIGLKTGYASSQSRRSHRVSWAEDAQEKTRAVPDTGSVPTEAIDSEHSQESSKTDMVVNALCCAGQSPEQRKGQRLALLVKCSGPSQALIAGVGLAEGKLGKTGPLMSEVPMTPINRQNSTTSTDSTSKQQSSYHPFLLVYKIDEQGGEGDEDGLGRGAMEGEGRDVSGKGSQQRKRLNDGATDNSSKTSFNASWPEDDIIIDEMVEDELLNNMMDDDLGGAMSGVTTAQSVGSGIGDPDYISDTPPEPPLSWIVDSDGAFVTGSAGNAEDETDYEAVAAGGYSDDYMVMGPMDDSDTMALMESAALKQQTHGSAQTESSRSAEEIMRSVTITAPSVSLLLLQCLRLPPQLDTPSYYVHAVTPLVDGLHLAVTVNRIEDDVVEEDAITSAVLVYKLTFGADMTGIAEIPAHVFYTGPRTQFVRVASYCLPSASDTTLGYLAATRSAGHIDVIDLESGAVVSTLQPDSDDKFVHVVHIVESDCLVVATEKGAVVNIALNDAANREGAAVEQDELEAMLTGKTEYDVEKMQTILSRDDSFPQSNLTTNDLYRMWQLTRTDTTLEGTASLGPLGGFSRSPLSPAQANQQLQVQAPPCWTEIQQHQRMRKNPQHYLHDDRLTRTWSLVPDTKSWREHLFEVSLPTVYTVGHLDIKLSLHPLIPAVPSIRVTLLAPNGKTPPPLPDCLDCDSGIALLIDRLNARVIAGPVDISCTGSDLSELSCFLQFDTSELELCSTKVVFVYIQASADDDETEKFRKLLHKEKKLANQQKDAYTSSAVLYPSKVPHGLGGVGRGIGRGIKAGKVAFQTVDYDTLSSSDPYGPYFHPGGGELHKYFGRGRGAGKPPSVPKPWKDIKSVEKLKGCDWIQELSISAWRARRTCMENERRQRYILVHLHSIHERLVEHLTRTDAALGTDAWLFDANLVLDMLIWVVSAARTNTRSCELLSTLTTALCSNLEVLLRRCVITADRSLAHKFASMFCSLLGTIAEIAPNELHICLHNASVVMSRSMLECHSAAAAHWLFFIVQRLLVASTSVSGGTLTAESAELGKTLVTTVRALATEADGRSNEATATLADRFGLFGLPIELPLFELVPPTLELTSRVEPQSYSQAISGNTSTIHATANFSKDMTSVSYDCLDLLGLSADDRMRSLGLSIACLRAHRRPVMISRRHLAGLVEVEPLHYEVRAASDGIKLEDLITNNVQPIVNRDSSITGWGNGPISLPNLTQIESAANLTPAMACVVSTMKQQVQCLLNKQMQLLELQEHSQKLDDETTAAIAAATSTGSVPPSDPPVTHSHTTHSMTPPPGSTTQQSSASTFGVPTTPKTTPFMTPTPLSPNHLSPMNSEMQLNTASGSSQNASGARVATALLSNDLMALPTPSALIIDRMSGGARRFAILRFDRPVLLTDILIPQCADLGSIAIDVWLGSESLDGQRLAVSQDISQRSLVLTDLQPPLLCQFVKLNYIGRHGMTAVQSKIPLGYFYGHSYFKPWQAYASQTVQATLQTRKDISAPSNSGDGAQDQLDAADPDFSVVISRMDQLSEDIRCRFSLAVDRLEHCVELLATGQALLADVAAATPMFEAYNECMQLKTHWNVIQRTLSRLSDVTVTDAPVSLAGCCTDKLWCLSELCMEQLVVMTGLVPGKQRIMLLSENLLNLDLALELFKRVCISGSIKLQACCLTWLLEFCCHQEWFGAFLSRLLLDLFGSTSRVCFAKDRVFLMLSYLGQKAVRAYHTHVIEDAMRTVCELLEDSERMDQRAVNWLVLFLCSCFDAVCGSSSNTRWDFLLCEHTPRRPQLSKNAGETANDPVQSGAFRTRHTAGRKHKKPSSKSSKTVVVSEAVLANAISQAEKTMTDGEQLVHQTLATLKNTTHLALEKSKSLQQQADDIKAAVASLRKVTSQLGELPAKNTSSTATATASTSSSFRTTASRASVVTSTASTRVVQIKLNGELCQRTARALARYLLSDAVVTQPLEIVVVMCKVFSAVSRGSSIRFSLVDVAGTGDGLSQLLDRALTSSDKWLRHSLTAALQDYMRGEYKEQSRADKQASISVPMSIRSPRGQSMDTSPATMYPATAASAKLAITKAVNALDPVPVSNLSPALTDPVRKSALWKLAYEVVHRMLNAGKPFTGMSGWLEAAQEVERYTASNNPDDPISYSTAINFYTQYVSSPSAASTVASLFFYAFDGDAKLAPLPSWASGATNDNSVAARIEQWIKLVEQYRKASSSFFGPMVPPPAASFTISGPSTAMLVPVSVNLPQVNSDGAHGPVGTATLELEQLEQLVVTSTAGSAPESMDMDQANINLEQAKESTSKVLQSLVNMASMMHQAQGSQFVDPSKMPPYMSMPIIMGISHASGPAAAGSFPAILPTLYEVKQDAEDSNDSIATPVPPVSASKSEQEHQPPTETVSSDSSSVASDAESMADGDVSSSDSPEGSSENKVIAVAEINSPPTDSAVSPMPGLLPLEAPEDEEMLTPPQVCEDVSKPPPGAVLDVNKIAAYFAEQKETVSVPNLTDFLATPPENVSVVPTSAEAIATTTASASSSRKDSVEISFGDNAGHAGASAGIVPVGGTGRATAKLSKRIEHVSLSVDERLESELGWSAVVEARRHALLDGMLVADHTQFPYPFRNQKQQQGDTDHSALHINSSVPALSQWFDMKFALYFSDITVEHPEMKGLLELYWSLSVAADGGQAKASSSRQFDASSIAIRIPRIPLSDGTISALLEYLATNCQDASNEFWVIAFRTLTVAANYQPPDILRDQIALLIVRSAHLPTIVKNFAAIGGGAATLHEVGPTSLQAFTDLITRLHASCHMYRKSLVMLLNSLVNVFIDMLEACKLNSSGGYATDVLNGLASFIATRPHSDLSIESVERLMRSTAKAACAYLAQCNLGDGTTHTVSGATNPRLCSLVGTGADTVGVSFMGDFARVPGDWRDSMLISALKLCSQLAKSHSDSHAATQTMSKGLSKDDSQLPSNPKQARCSVDDAVQAEIVRNVDALLDESQPVVLRSASTSNMPDDTSGTSLEQKAKKPPCLHSEYVSELGETFADRLLQSSNGAQVIQCLLRAISHCFTVGVDLASARANTHATSPNSLVTIGSVADGVFSLLFDIAANAGHLPALLRPVIDFIKQSSRPMRPITTDLITVSICTLVDCVDSLHVFYELGGYQLLVDRFVTTVDRELPASSRDWSSMLKQSAVLSSHVRSASSSVSASSISSSKDRKTPQSAAAAQWEMDKDYGMASSAYSYGLAASAAPGGAYTWQMPPLQSAASQAANDRRPPDTKIDGYFNFAPIGTITSSSPMAQHLGGLLASTPSHRRARSPHWSYHFYPAETWLDITISLPYAIQLKEVQIRPHVQSLVSCPAAVQVELAPDLNVNSLRLFGPPTPSLGQQKIRACLSKHDSPVQMVRLHLKRPLECSNVAISQILLLGEQCFAIENFSLNVHKDESMRYLHVLHHCTFSILPCTPPGCPQLLVGELLAACPSLVTALLRLLLSTSVNGSACPAQIERLLLAIDSAPLQSNGVVELMLQELGATYATREFAQRWFISVFHSLMAVVDDKTQHRCSAVLTFVTSLSQHLAMEGSSPLVCAAATPLILRACAAVLWNHPVVGSLIDVKTVELIYTAARVCESQDQSRALCCILCSLLHHARPIYEASEKISNHVGEITMERLTVSEDCRKTAKLLQVVAQSKELCDLLMSSGRLAMWLEAVSSSVAIEPACSIWSLVSSLCSQRSICDYLCDEAQRHWPALLNLLCLSSNCSASPDVLAGMEKAAVRLFAAVLPGRAAAQRAFCTIMCQLLTDNEQSINGSVQRIILQVLLEDERTTVQITHETRDKPVEPSTLKQHPHFGCSRNVDVQQMSYYTPCGDLLKAKKAKTSVCDLINRARSRHPATASQPDLKDAVAAGIQARARRSALKPSGRLGSRFAGGNATVPIVRHRTLGNIPPQTRFGQLATALRQKGQESTEDVLELEVVHVTQGEEGVTFNETVAATQMQPSTLEIFAKEGGLVLLAQHLQLYPASVLQSLYARSKYHADQSVTEKDVKLLDDYMTQQEDALLPTVDMFTDVDASTAGSDWAVIGGSSSQNLSNAGFVSSFGGPTAMDDLLAAAPSTSGAAPLMTSQFGLLSPHVILSFSLFLRLSTYAELLIVEHRRKAQWLLRLALGVTTDCSGESIFSLPNTGSLSTLPFDVLTSLFLAEPSPSLRQNALDLGVLDVILTCLSAFSHQKPQHTPKDEPKPHIVALLEQALSLLDHADNLQVVQQQAQPSGSTGAQPSTSAGPSGMPSSAGSLFGAGTVGEASKQQYWAKGTGFGTGSTQAEWNMSHAMRKQLVDEQNVTCLLKVLSAYINPTDWTGLQRRAPLAQPERSDTPDEHAQPGTSATAIEQQSSPVLSDRFVANFADSCIIPTMAGYLRNDSVLDLSRHLPVYEGVLYLFCSALTNEKLRAVLAGRVGQGEQGTDSLIALFTKLRRHVESYVAKVRPLDSASGVATKTSNDEEGIMKLIPLFDRTHSILQQFEAVGITDEHMDDVNLPVEPAITLSPDEIYCKAMKELQFDSVPFFDESASSLRFVVPYNYESSVRQTGGRTGEGCAGSRTRRLAQETVTLSTCLPLSASSCVFVRTAQERLDIMKVLMTGPADTPYANGCFEFDVWFPADYPNSPMHVNLQTTGGKTVRFNPNLYNDGKVCLSVLNTWHGRPEERWTPNSSLLQVLVSIQSLILVSDPYFNEPGYERTRGTQAGQSASRDYDANIRQATARWGMLEMVRSPSACFKEVIQRHFYLKKDEILNQLETWLKEMDQAPSSSGGSTATRLQRSLHAHASALRQHYNALKEEFAKLPCPAEFGEAASAAVPPGEAKNTPCASSEIT